MQHKVEAKIRVNIKSVDDQLLPHLSELTEFYKKMKTEYVFLKTEIKKLSKSDMQARLDQKLTFKMAEMERLENVEAKIDAIENERNQFMKWATVAKEHEERELF